MSREKECKCCHEWWYASVIKEDLCPNCYDYFKQLKQQLAEKDNFILNLKIRTPTKLAIAELEKVKTLIQNAINFVRPNFVEVYDAINKQIKELRGEKDVKD